MIRKREDEGPDSAAAGGGLGGKEGGAAPEDGFAAAGPSKKMATEGGAPRAPPRLVYPSMNPSRLGANAPAAGGPLGGPRHAGP